MVMLQKPDQALTNQRKLDDGREPCNKQRRAIIGGGLAALAAPRLLLSPRPAMAWQGDEQNAPNDPFILLLHGIYQPVPKGRGPNLGLSNTFNLSDGTYTVTKIYPVFGISNEDDEQGDQHGQIGNFFISYPLCAYQLPEARSGCTSTRRWRVCPRV
jgi:hypothetical protein